MEELIIKYLQGNLSGQETQTLKEWLKEDSSHRKVFENIVSGWNLSEKDIEKAKHKVFRHITRDVPKAGQSKKVRPVLWGYLVGAAATIGLIAILIIWHQPVVPAQEKTAVSQEILIEKETAPGQKLTFELPDGTLVKLNASSKITFPQVFGQHVREVSLTGEAFFSVTRDESKPFRITSNDMLVEVLGTSFNVRSYDDEDFATVAVKTGKVAVKSPDEQLFLLPKEAATLKPGLHGLSKTVISNDLLFFGWIDQQIIFQEESIGEIFKTLSRWYDVDFVVKKKLNEKKEFTAKYKNPVLTEVMESLSYAYEFNYTMNGKKVIIQ